MTSNQQPRPFTGWFSRQASKSVSNQMGLGLRKQRPAGRRETIWCIAVFLLMLDHITLSAQTLNKKTTSQLELLDDLRWDDGRNLDIDSLVGLTGKSLIRQLTKGRVSLRGAPENFQQLSSKDGLIRIYTFSYSLGGTASKTYNPVLQWRKKNGSFGAVKLFWPDKNGFVGLDDEFYKIHRLPASGKNLYLLLGSSRIYFSLWVHRMFVVELKDDAPVLTYPAFLNKHAVLTCYDDLHDDLGFVDLRYSPKTKVLTLAPLGADDEVRPKTKLHNPKMNIPHRQRLSFVFKNGRFVRR